jgi:hypothetical protein
VKNVVKKNGRKSIARGAAEGSADFNRRSKK